MRINASGNLGLGVVPSAWAVGKVIQVNTGGAFLYGSANAILGFNAYYSSAWKYVNSDYATYYEQASGEHRWNTSASGTANGNITFTQAMTLDASGNLGIGTTGPESKFHIFNSNNLGGTTGDYLLLKSLQNPGGAGGNNAYERTWAYRTGTGTDWTTWSIWTGISIDASFGTPTTSKTWYWREPLSGKQHFGDSTTNVMTIGPSNVGIGTTAPVSKLDVRGYITAGTTSSTSGTILMQGLYGDGALTTFSTMYSSGGPVIGYGVTPSTSTNYNFLSSTGVTLTRGAYYIEGGNHIWYSGATQTVSVGGSVTMTEQMRITSGGSLGLGTTAPNLFAGGTAFSLLSSSGYGGIEIMGSGSTNGGQIDLGSGTTRYASIVGEYSSSTNGLIIFRTLRSGTITEALRITSGGDMGLGTTAPAAKLDIIGSLRSEITSDGNFVTLQATGQRVHYIKRSGQILQFTSDGANPYDVQFDSSNKSVYIASGNLGLGLTTPQQKLHVHNAGTSYVHISNNSTGTTSSDGADIGFFNNEIILNITNRENADMVFSTNNTERLRITSGGNVQIGTTSSSDFRLYSYQNASTGNSTTSALVVRQDGTDPIAIFQGSGGSSKMRISSDGKINFSSLPTSATGLSAGDIWNNGGVLNIV